MTPLFRNHTLALLVFAAAARGVERADFAIIESFDRLTVYNRYEQPLSEHERRSFLPFAPLRIRERDQVLGDMITRALSFTHKGETYYALHGHDGGRVDKRFRRILTGCTVLDDTVVVTASNKVRFTPSLPNVRTLYLPKGERLARVFRSGNRCYVLRLGDRPMYGWSPARSAWRAPREADDLDDGTMSVGLRQRLLGRIDQINETYAQFFGHFSELTGEHRSVPVWMPAEQGADRLSWRLSKPYGNDERLTRSTRYLIEDLEGMLLGKPYTVTFSNGVLAVVPRAPTIP
ncbi:MAG: hypothetical protein GF331_14640 [Chitinivibrionales bacterium]|nr:hypothetical protein [Chitinivibrionales bacterium]